jgi:small-conductance mechanosensitive channel
MLGVTQSWHRLVSTRNEYSVKRRLSFSIPSIIAVQMVILTLMLTACQTAQIDPPNDLNQDEILTTREPPPVPTPSAVDEAIADFAYSAGLGDQTVLGLTIDAWINIALSMALVLGGYLLIVWLLRSVDSWMLQRMSDEEVKKWRDLIRPSVRWLVLVTLLYLATIRLGFLNAFLRQALLDLYFVVAVALSTNIAWQTIDLIAHLYRNRIVDKERLLALDPALILLTRLARIFLIAVMVSIVLSHFGINVMALSAAVGLGGLALSLAARDTIADAIAGMIILFDRPFRVGDRIEIQEANTWGDVAEIGLRTTRIRTRDNRGSRQRRGRCEKHRLRRSLLCRPPHVALCHLLA